MPSGRGVGGRGGTDHRGVDDGPRPAGAAVHPEHRRTLPRPVSGPPVSDDAASGSRRSPDPLRRGGRIGGDHDLPGVHHGTVLGADPPPATRGVDGGHPAVQRQPFTHRQGQLLWQSGHSAGGQPGNPEGEHPNQQQGERVGCRPGVVEHDSGQEPVDDAAQFAGHPAPVESVHQSGVLAGGMLEATRTQRGARPPGQRHQVTGPYAPSSEHGGNPGRRPQRMDQGYRTPFPAYSHSRRERLQSQPGKVDAALKFGIGGVEHLETAIAAEAVDHVGPYPAADLIGGLPDPHLPARLGEQSRAAQSCQPGTDDHYLDVLDIHRATLPRRG